MGESINGSRKEQGTPWQEVSGGVSAPQGFVATGVKAGIKYKDKYDLAILYSETEASAAGTFTRNLVKAHPLVLTEKHLQNGTARAVVVNSGNANACMGKIGDQAALEMARCTAEVLALPLEEVLVSSTGVIGMEIPMEKVVPGIRQAAIEIQELRKLSDASIKEEHARRASMAIMTTDLTRKEKAYELSCEHGTICLGIMAKGSGMIHPNMGTMLCFVTTDAKVEAGRLKELLRGATDESFNMVTVDGDTSTNDMVVMMANGRSGVEPVGKEWEAFAEMVKEACVAMAIEIARDGEGATKLLEIQVSGAKTLEGARQIARSVCSSSLVKSAMYGEDANWGRILAAAGYSGAYFDPDKADIFLSGLQVASGGQGLKFPEDQALERLKKNEVILEIRLKDGLFSATAWGCDLTHKYVDINANYRT